MTEFHPQHTDGADDMPGAAEADASSNDPHAEAENQASVSGKSSEQAEENLPDLRG